MRWQGKKDFKNGDRVVHSLYGQGTFIEYDPLDSQSANIKLDTPTPWGAHLINVDHKYLKNAK